MRVALATAAAFLALAGAAYAHVTVIPSSARPGETRTLTFRVLNEREDAKTVGVDVFLPAGLHATAGIRRGWSAVANGGQLTWTADSPDDAIGGDASLDFQVKAGPLPETDQLVFKVLQHYDDGQVVRWIQDPQPGADRPAPVVQLTATGRPQTTGGGSSATVGWVVIGALAAVALGGAALFARRRRRR